jgi:lipoprotein NlpD
MAAMRAAIAALLLAALAGAFAGCATDPLPPLQVLGTWHQVQPGDTVRSVADRYGADPEVLAELNDLPRDGEIAGRAEIFVPKAGGAAPGTGAPPPAPIAATPDPTPAATAGSPSPSGTDGRCGSGATPCLAWPLDGEVSAGFGDNGSGPHDGIDIPAARGTPIRAAAAGRVLYSGDAIKGYGNLVIVRHEGGLITVYAHCERNLVSEGDDVTRGQKVAEVGDTGTAKTPHLHFEVRIDEQPRDPLTYLRPRKKEK